MKIQELAEKVTNAIEEQFGSVDECCTLANRSIWELCRKIGQEGRLIRIDGYVCSEGEEFAHEWAEFDGETVDATARQFAGEIGYVGEEADWPRLSETEMAEVRGIVDAVCRELSADALAEYMEA